MRHGGPGPSTPLRISEKGPMADWGPLAQLWDPVICQNPINKKMEPPAVLRRPKVGT
ncbi:unnamed protein product, partial [Staurois parvus]